jgi:hypothetical protein
MTRLQYLVNIGQANRQDVWTKVCVFSLTFHTELFCIHIVGHLNDIKRYEYEKGVFFVVPDCLGCCHLS